VTEADHVEVSSQGIPAAPEWPEGETPDPPAEPTSWFAGEFTAAHAEMVTGFDALKAQIAADSAALHADMDARWQDLGLHYAKACDPTTCTTCLATAEDGER
jgi:hypothetical protein